MAISLPVRQIYFSSAALGSNIASFDIIEDCTLIAITCAAAIAGAAAADTNVFLQFGVTPAFNATTNDARGAIANFVWSGEFETAIGRNYQAPFWVVPGLRLAFKASERIYAHGLYSGTQPASLVCSATFYFV